MSADHDTPINTPKQLITVIVLSFIVPILLIVLLVKFVGAGKRTGAGTQSMTADSIEARIKPVAGFELIDASAPRVLKSGEQIYTAQCSACHAAGVAGAPKTGDAAAWKARIDTGLEAMVASALKGKGAMPAQGGGAASDFEILRAVVHMANASGGSLTEPAPPAAPAAK